MLWITFLLQIFSYSCFCLQDFSKIVRLLLAAVSINGLSTHTNRIQLVQKVSLIRAGLSRYLETGCPNKGFIDFCVSKVLFKIHTTNKIDPKPLQILLF